MIHDAVESVFERGSSEIDEQANLEIEQLQVGQKLLAMHRSKSFHGLQLDANEAIDDEIGTKSLLINNSLIANRNHNLTFDCKSRLNQFPLKNRLIDRFQQPGPKISMDLNRKINNPPSNKINPLIAAMLCHNQSLLIFPPLRASAPLRETLLLFPPPHLPPPRLRASA